MRGCEEHRYRPKIRRLVHTEISFTHVVHLDPSKHKVRKKKVLQNSADISPLYSNHQCETSYIYTMANNILMQGYIYTVDKTLCPPEFSHDDNGDGYNIELQSHMRRRTGCRVGRY